MGRFVFGGDIRTRHSVETPSLGGIGTIDYISSGLYYFFLSWLPESPKKYARCSWRRDIPQTVYMSAATLSEEISDRTLKAAVKNSLRWILRRYGCRCAQLFHSLDENPVARQRQISNLIVREIGKF